MIIQHNLSALNTYNHFNKANMFLSKAAEKLSSGLRINQACDDAAGLAISEKMRAQIRGLYQAQRNIQDGISLIQTVEGALAEIENSNLQRMRELAVQASNGTVTDQERQMIQREISQIIDEIEAVADNTEFNGKKLLNGPNVQITPGETTVVAKTEVITPAIGVIGVYILDYTQNLSSTLAFGLEASPANTHSNAMFSFSNPPVKPNYIYSPLGTDTQSTLENLVATFNSIKNDTSGDPDITLHKNFINDNNIQIRLYGMDVIVLTADTEIYFNQMPAGPDGSRLMSGCWWAVAGYTVDFTYHELQTTPSEINIMDTILQVGPNSQDIFKIALPNAKTSQIGINNIDVTNQSNAEQAISMIDQAIDTILAERSKFGAYQNALEHILRNVANSSENLTSAESRVRDADMAKEMMGFLKESILLEASQALLQQANQSQDRILNLLKS
ncbi:flagellin [Desulforamulus ruminis]|uniref:Flagellin n=1 Tax=Desulforamulus ruminis (strain ATCC 23193 / DSM 2154 / NCIMB 8452 / DL) TaxID=696281 RepID=F6DV22_DESRL|nr:flagellin [Desulforamulus ruminis]AEG59088.1 flagellin domain protein [Desulforamulus ruminis DSM 2154]